MEETKCEREGKAHGLNGIQGSSEKKSQIFFLSGILRSFKSGRSRYGKKLQYHNL